MTEKSPEDKLNLLTVAECAVLYWICNGRTRVEIAELLFVKEGTVYFHIGNIYEKLGIRYLSEQNRFLALGQTFCPLLLERVKDPARDCRAFHHKGKKRPRWLGTETPPIEESTNRSESESTASGSVDSRGTSEPDVEQTDDEEDVHVPDPETLALVKRDEERGIIPVRRSIVVRPHDSVAILPPKNGEKPVKEPPWLLYLLLVLVGVLIGAVLTIAIMWGRPQPPPSPGPATSTPQSNPQQQPGSGARPSATAVPPPISSVQSPAPGSVIPAGQTFTLRGVTVAARRQLDISGRYIGVDFDISNGSSDQIIIRWKPSAFHLQDDQGRVFHQFGEDSADFNKVYQFSLSPGASQTIHASTVAYFDTSYTMWVGQIDPTAKSLIFRVDDIAGLSNLSWRFDM